MHPLDRGAHRLDPSDPRLRVIALQVLAAIGLIIVGAVFFIDAVNNVAHALGVSEVLLALVIAPIATELPEKFNSIIWVRQNKDTLALGNITGAMVFQSTIPTVVGLTLAAETWVVGEGSYTAFASAAIALIATAVIFIPARRRGGLEARHLLVGGIFYLGLPGLRHRPDHRSVRWAGGHRRRRGRMRFAASSVASAAIKSGGAEGHQVVAHGRVSARCRSCPARFPRRPSRRDRAPPAAVRDRRSPTRRRAPSAARCVRPASGPARSARGPTQGPGRLCRRPPRAMASSIRCASAVVVM